MLFVFATAVHTSILGTLFTFASRALDSTYAARGAELDVDATDDQRPAGLVMWIPAGMVFALASLGLFAAWLGEPARLAAQAERRPGHMPCEVERHVHRSIQRTRNTAR